MAEAADHAALLEHTRHFYEGIGEASHLPFDAEKTAWWVARSIAKALALLADPGDGSIAGALALDDEAPRYSAAKALWDIGFYVRPEYRKSRAAALLVGAAKAIAADMELPLFIGVSSGFELDRQDKFFTRAGFQRVGALYLLR